MPKVSTYRYSGECYTAGQCEVLGKPTSLLGFQPPTLFNPLQDSQSLKGFQSKAFRHFVKMSDRELRTHQILDVFSKTTNQTPKSVIERCQKRLKDYDKI
jgi:hypothetical protein